MLTLRVICVFVVAVLPAQLLCTAPRRHAMTSRHLNVGGMTLSFQIRLTSEKEAGEKGGLYLRLRDIFHMFAFLLVQEWAANVIIMPIIYGQEAKSEKILSTS